MTKQQIEDRRNSFFSSWNRPQPRRQSAYMIQVWISHKSRWKCYGLTSDPDEVDRLFDLAIDRNYPRVRVISPDNTVMSI